jgi:hypothetical protein
MISVFKQSFLTVTTIGLTARKFCLLFHMGGGWGGEKKKRKKEKKGWGGCLGFQRNKAPF